MVAGNVFLQNLKWCVYILLEPPAKGISGQYHSTGPGENNMLTTIELFWISQGKARCVVEGFSLKENG